MFRAFYKPSNNNYDETFVDGDTLAELPAGAIFVVKINEDGSRELHHDEGKVRSLTAKEARFHRYAQRHLEFKHDGGDTPEMKLEKMKRMGRI